MEDNFLTAAEASKQLKVSKELMARYCREGRLQGCFRKGKIWLIPRNSLEKFQQIQKRYKPGRPRQKAFNPIFWRENSVPNPEEAIQILLGRNPRLIPRMIPRSVSYRFARHGRTRLERTVRQSLLEGLYGPS